MKDPQAEADSFNARAPVGTLVWYWRGAREGKPSGAGKIYNEATVLGGHTAVTWIGGCSGAIALTHVDVVVGEVETLRARILELTRALRWYADRENYEPCSKLLSGSVRSTVIEVVEDDGRRAEAALARDKELANHG